MPSLLSRFRSLLGLSSTDPVDPPAISGPSSSTAPVDLPRANPAADHDEADPQAGQRQQDEGDCPASHDEERKIRPTISSRSSLSCVPAWLVEDDQEEAAWLVEDIWSDQAVGLIGGTPGSCKSWLSAHLAVSVASGQPFLGKYQVGEVGPVVLFPAEDRASSIKARLAGIAEHSGVNLDDLPIHLITEARLAFDTPGDQERLRDLVDKLRPKLLILDPLVRLYSQISESSAEQMSAFLGFFRGLQREFGTAVLIVHHARKQNNTSGPSSGQDLRGSTELHAWRDSLIVAAKTDAGIRLSIEHRAARSPDPILVRLVEDGGPAHLEIVEDAGDQQDEGQDLGDEILGVIEKNPGASTRTIRGMVTGKSSTISEVINELMESGAILRRDGGWYLAGEEEKCTPEYTSGKVNGHHLDHVPSIPVPG